MALVTKPPFDFTVTSNTNSTTIAYVNEDLLPTGLDITMKVLYVVVAVMGLFGNGLIFYLFASKRVRLTPFNIFLLNLSIADTLADLSIWPYVFIDLKSLRSLGEDAADSVCVLVMGQMTYWIATVAALFTLSVISVSRYIFIRHPMKSQYFHKNHASYIVILLIWPVSVGMCMPNFFSLKYNKTFAVCERIWPDEVNGQVYSGITALLGYVIPILVLLFTYVGTRQYLWLTRTNDLVRSTCSVRRRKTASMLLAALVLAFFVCWSPFFIYWILSRTATTIFPDGPKGDYARMRIIIFVVFVSLCNTVADPIIYGLRGEDFRKSLRDLRENIPCFATRRRERARTKSSECPDSRCDEHRIHLNRL